MHRLHNWMTKGSAFRDGGHPWSPRTPVLGQRMTGRVDLWGRVLGFPLVGLGDWAVSGMSPRLRIPPQGPTSAACDCSDASRASAHRTERGVTV